MNGIAFGIAAWIALGMDLGLREALQLGGTGVAPGFVLMLVLFVAIWAPSGTAAAAALVGGALTDLTRLVPTSGGESLAVLGPHALGYLLGAYAVVMLRALVFRKSPLTIGILFALGGSVAAALTAALLTMRSFTDPDMVVLPGRVLWEGVGSSIYAAVLAVLLSPLQRVLIPLLGFRRAATRGIDQWS